jgi:MIP family channel proteins
MMAKRLGAEFLGTFMIVFAPVAASVSKAGLGVAAAVSGLAVLVMIYTFGPISSAHFNPAVTLGFASVGRFPWRSVAPYWLSQVCGALAAAAVCALLFGPGHGAHLPASDNWVRNVGTEFVLTFLLMLVIIAVATERDVSPVVPAIAIGVAVMVCVLIGGPITGGSMNPARSLGPAMFAPAAVGKVWLYVVVPPIGAVVAAWTYELVRLEPNRATC